MARARQYCEAIFLRSEACIATECSLVKEWSLHRNRDSIAAKCPLALGRNLHGYERCGGTCI